ncbi:MAG TPA: chemotaxis protein CheW [Gemmatimonadales bacterium]|jgi:chemotaxis signal transduction protein|nr:chemotaxis protein CheW [Gemmatimonadales bacterium]
MTADATCRYLLVQAGGRLIGLEVAEVLEVVDLAATFAVPTNEPALRGVVAVRERLVPVVNLSAVLWGDSPSRMRGEVGVLARAGRQRICLEVDSAEAVLAEDVVPVPAGESLPWAMGVARRDGALVPILDLKALGARLLGGKSGA